MLKVAPLFYQPLLPAEDLALVTGEPQDVDDDLVNPVFLSSPSRKMTQALLHKFKATKDFELFVSLILSDCRLIGETTRENFMLLGFDEFLNEADNTAWLCELIGQIDLQDKESFFKLKGQLRTLTFDKLPETIRKAMHQKADEIDRNQADEIEQLRAQLAAIQGTG